MTGKKDMPAVIVLRPNAAALWLTYLIWLPTLTLCCAGLGISLFSGRAFDTGSIVALTLGIGFLVGWLLLVRKTLRTISSFRFNVAARSVTVTYPSAKREFLKAEEIAYCRTLQGSPSRPHYDGAKDRVLHLRSGQEFLLADLHITRINPETFDRLMDVWDVPVHPLPVEPAPDQSARFSTNAQGGGVYLYRPRWGWILFCLALAIASVPVGLDLVQQSFESKASVWPGVLFAGLLVLGAYALAGPLVSHPLRAELGTSGIELRYLLRSRKRIPWAMMSGYAIGKVMVGRFDTKHPAVIIYLKNGPAVLLATLMIKDIQYAPFANFGLLELEAPRPFHFFNKIPDRPGR